jgi:CRP/FNR family nitrogen fixation transcriptional regulator
MSGAVQSVIRQPMGMAGQVSTPTRVTDPLAALIGMTISLPRDRELYAQGERAEYCYQVISGCLRTVKLMEDGRRQVAAFLLPGDCLGFDDFDSHDFAAQAVTDVAVRRFRRHDVEAQADRQLALARRLRELGASALRAAHDRLLLLGRKTAPERIATFLLEMAARQQRQHQSHVVTLPMSRVDIADHLGMTVETVCRMITHLRREGTIAVVPSGVELHAPGALRHTAADLRH